MSTPGKEMARAKLLKHSASAFKNRKQGSVAGKEGESSRKWSPRRNKAHMTLNLVGHFKILTFILIQ